jgi:ArsR family transcriptional regulator
MVGLFKALAEESRLRILSLVIENEMCVCEIESILNLTQSNASRHLTVLKQCGILQSYKKAQWAYYRISDKFMLEQNDLYHYLQIKLKELPTYQKDYMEYEKCKQKDVCAQNIKPH